MEELVLNNGLEDIIYPIMMYMAFTAEKKLAKEATIHIDKFKDDIKTLTAQGYVFVSLADILAHKKSRTTLPKKLICLVLFGGYCNHYDLAFPVLKECNIHADMFVATDLMGVSECPGIASFTPHYSWQQANEMKQSGLVDIYAMWHPFDHGKEADVELEHKIELIRQNISESNPQIACCMNMDDNDGKKQAALEKAGVGLNLVYYWSFNFGEVEGQVPYIGVNQESNVLDVIDHFCAKLNSQLKLAKNAKWIGEQHVEWNPQCNSIILPINTKPLISNLLRNAIPLSVISAVRKDREALVVLNNYIEVVSRPWYHFFDYDNHLYLNWPELTCCRLTKELLNITNANVADVVLRGLCVGYYSDVWTDEYYIPHKSGFGKRHLTHNILIYGYDGITNEFLCLAYIDSGHYESFSLKPNDLIRSSLSEYFCSIQLIKNNPDCQVAYDINMLSKKLKRYINSEYEFANNTKCSQYDPNQLVNFDACRNFSRYVADIAEKENRIYLVCFYTYTEHKKCMGWRLHYIAQKEYFDTNYFAAYREYAEKTSQKLLNLALKFNMTGKKSIIYGITSIMDELNEKEREAIYKMLEYIG